MCDRREACCFRTFSSRSGTLQGHASICGAPAHDAPPHMNSDIRHQLGCAALEGTAGFMSRSSKEENAFSTFWYDSHSHLSAISWSSQANRHSPGPRSWALQHTDIPRHTACMHRTSLLREYRNAMAPQSPRISKAGRPCNASAQRPHAITRA